MYKEAKTHKELVENLLAYAQTCHILNNPELKLKIGRNKERQIIVNEFQDELMYQVHLYENNEFEKAFVGFTLDTAMSECYAYCEENDFLPD